MKAKSLLKARVPLGDDRFMDTVIWQVPAPLPGSPHPYKYRLAYVVAGQCVLRYDNEAGKGDHKHVGETEVPYRFVDTDTLVDDFLRDIDQWEANDDNCDR